MEKLDITITGCKEVVELGDGIIKLVTALKPIVKDGVSLSEVPHLAIAVGSLVPYLKGVDKVGDEFKEDPEAFIMSIAYLVCRLIKEFQAKEVA
jgi:hypothetical protein